MSGAVHGSTASNASGHRPEFREISLSDLTTRITVHGSGSDLLWIAGGGYLGESWHEHFVPHFAHRYRSITFDNRGSDLTECRQELPWSIADMARDAAELLERTATGPAAVVGHSMGGAIALQIALDRPDLVSCVISMASGADTSRHWAGDFMRAEIALRDSGVRLSRDFAVAHYAPLLYPAEALGDPAMWETVKAELSAPSFYENNENTVASQWRACAEFDVLHRMSELAVPVHFVAFEQDVSAPPELSRRSAEASALADFHEIPGLGHCSLFRHRPADVSAVIGDILAAHAPPEQETVRS